MSNRKMRFSRTKIATLVSALMLASSNVNALGLGVLDVKSNLDQPLNGVIELRVNPGDDIGSVRAAIASKQDFNSFGIDYPSYLDNVKVRVDRSSGAPKLLVDSSGVVIQEPFVHLLIRVDWAGGSFLREYTALIDPPVYAAGAPKSFSNPVTVGSDQSYQRAPTQNYNVQPTIRSAPASNYSSSSRSSFNNDANYGPVSAGESLSTIANELQFRFPDLSIYQIMKVLFEENPNAFINGNINGLIRGSILNLGDINAIRAVDIQDAKNFFSAQASDWDNIQSSGDVSSLKVGQDQYKDSENIFSDTTSGAIQDSFQVGASTDTDSLISDSDIDDSGSGEVVVLRQQISELESSLSSSALENQELKERVSILEGQLADMNDLLKLNVEDVDLASFEDSLAKNNAAAEQALNDELKVVDDVVSGSLDTTIDEGLQIVDDAGVELVDPVVGENVDLDSVAVIETDDVTGDVETSVIEDVETAAVDKPKPIIVPVSEPSLFEKAKGLLFDGGIWKVLVGLGGVLAIALGALFIRRRRADEEFEISMLSIESNSQSIDTIDSASLSRSMSASVTASVNEGAAAEGEENETSFLTVYSDSDAVVQADEVDPIAEADVYIAYGRHEQAEEVLLDGITNYPKRTDIKHKLLTVYHKNNNSEGFERVAEELYSERDTLEPEVWQEICEMGREIDADNPLFELSPEDLVAAASVSEMVDSVEDGVIGGAELEEPSVQEVADAAERNSQFDVDVDDESVHLINFDEGRSEISELDEVQIDSLDIDSSSAEDVADEEINIDSILEMDDLGDDDEIEIEINDTELEVADDLNEIEINDSVIEIDDLELSDSINDVEIELSENDIDTDSIDLVSENLVDDIEFDLADDDSGDEEAEDDFDLGDLQEVSDLEIDEDHDELRTQYELAKVFADLGDEDGARKILNDIINDSSAAEDLVADSQALLQTIS